MPNIVKNTTFPSLFSLLAPHSCRGCGRIGDPLCNRCKKHIIKSHHNICPICKTQNSTGKCSKCQNLPPIFIVGNRSDLIGELVHDFKYSSTRALSHPLAEILNQILPSTKNPVIIVPLPTINHHIRERGFSHTQLLAKHLAKLHPNYTVQNLLIRFKNTVQVGASRQARLTQASSAYTLSPNIKINQKATYILLDDVWTTGASLQSAYTELKKAGIKNITIAVLALSN